MTEWRVFNWLVGEGRIATEAAAGGLLLGWVEAVSLYESGLDRGPPGRGVNRHLRCCRRWALAVLAHDPVYDADARLRMLVDELGRVGFAQSVAWAASPARSRLALLCREAVHDYGVSRERARPTAG